MRLACRQVADTLSRSLGRFASSARLHPAVGGGIVGRLGADPASAVRTFAVLPKWRARLEIVHQEFGGGKSIMTMRGSRDNKHDRLTRCDAAVTMNDGDAEERPAALRRLDVACNLGLGHAWIVLERQ